VWKEGLLAGGLGALSVALLFLVLDLMRGRPLYTPSVLGQIVLLGRPTAVTDQILPDAVALYTVFHLVVFALFGVVVVKLVHLAINVAIARFGLLMLFVVFEVFFFAFTYVFFEGSRQLFPRGSILAANTLAAVVMATYLWHRHPALKRALRQHTLGVD
jgi:hypothetical protein